MAKVTAKYTDPVPAGYMLELSVEETEALHTVLDGEDEMYIMRADNPAVYDILDALRDARTA